MQVALMKGYTVALTTEPYTEPAFWWHAWDASGDYAGRADDFRWLALLIARHASR